MRKIGKLELTWVGKYDKHEIEPRILVEDKSKSFGDPDSENMLIHGDNLIALQALQQDFAGKIKCIYIDPPYNTGKAFDHYDDGLEHSIWLGLMRERFVLLKNLLADDGTFFCQVSDDEMAYAKVVLDEIFGRPNFINQVSVKMKQTAGASGGGEDKRLKKNIEFILIYAKDYSSFSCFNEVFEEEKLMELIEDMRENGKSWKYTRVFTNLGQRKFLCEIKDGSGMPIKIYVHEGAEIKTIPELMAQDNISEEDTYYKYFDNVFRDTNAQSSIRTRVMEATLGQGDFFSIEYTPRSGRRKGENATLYYKGNNRDLIAWLHDVAIKKSNGVVKLEKLGTFWSGFPLNNLTKEGSVKFPNGKKPEALIQRVLELATNPGDLVLDSFLGSGTTAAVAHKMGRHWIGIELGKHCYTHCIPRLQRVISGEDQGGSSKAVSWHGGGGYKFYELAPSLLVKNSKLPVYQINPEYTFEMLCEAICKLEGFRYKPQGLYHGHSSEKRFIHITKEFVNAEYINSVAANLGEDQSLLIYGTKIQSNLRLPDNIEVKKIPKDLLKKCEFESEVR